MGNLETRDYRRIVVIGVAVLCFAYIAYRIATNQSFDFDTELREWVYSLRTPTLNRIWIAVTYLGNWQTITLVVLGLLLAKSTRVNIGVPMAATAVASTCIYKLVKMIFQRPRPDLAVRLIEQGGYSFPSGHAMNGLVCYGILIYLVRRHCKNETIRNGLTILLSVLFISIGLSRVYVGVHYPSDILGGWCLGIVVLTIAVMCIERIRGKKT
ncbi:undecaprenyl-diphosphatase [Clostridiales Family XIII bacterium PM5-7]